MLPEHPFYLFFLLVSGHALGDFALQNAWVATNKNRHARADISMGRDLRIWPHLLTAHCLHHAFIMFFITQNIRLSMAEFITHWITDFGKNEGWYDFHVDQFIHIGFKILWTVLITMKLI